MDGENIKFNIIADLDFKFIEGNHSIIMKPPKNKCDENNCDNKLELEKNSITLTKVTDETNTFYEGGGYRIYPGSIWK